MQATGDGVVGDIKRIFVHGVKQAVAILFLLLMSFSPVYGTGSLFRLNIPAASAVDALDSLADQTGHSLFYPSNELKGVRVNTLNGSFSLPEALGLLLSNTNLNAVVTDKGVIVISIAPKNQPQQKSNGESEMQKRSKLSVGILAAIASFFGVGVAETVAQDGANSVLEELVVTGIRGSLSRALDQKRNAVGVVDAIASEDITDFPDLNIGEALQRVTGVTLTRSDNGEGRQISVRGLSPSFVRSTLNGITAASSATNGSDAIRAFDYDLFASELFSNVTLSKSGSADQTEGGIAASVDLQTPRPFDYDGQKMVASIRGQYAGLAGSSSSIDPRVAILASDTWNDDTVGVAASLAYSDTTSRGDLSERFRFQNSGAAFLTNTLDGADRTAGTADDLTQADLDALGTTVNGAPATLAQIQDIAANTITDSLPRVGPNVLDRERLGITTSFQLRPNDNLELSADLLYATYDNVGYRATIDGLTGFDRRGVSPRELNVESVAGEQVLASALLDNITQRTESVEDRFETDFLHFTLDGDWQINDQWSAFGKIGYSSSEQDELRRTYLYQHTGQFAYDLTASGDYPLIQGTDFDYLDPADYTAGGFRYRPRVREDEETSLQLDFTHAFVDAGALSALKFGFRFSEKEVSQVRGELRGSLDTFNALTGSGFGSDTPFSEISAQVTSVASGFLPGAPAGTPRNFLIIDPAAGATILPTSLTAQIDSDLLSSWTVVEDVSAFYLKTDWQPSWGAVDLGVRVVRTEQASIGTQAVGGVLEPITVENTYTDVLPGLNVRFDLSDDVILRFAANKAITRPTLGQLSPGTSVFPTLLTASGGNPNLDPFRATQYDLSFEWYFADEGLLSATIFYKDISSFVVNGTVSEVITGTNLIDDDGNNVSGSTFVVSRPTNGDGGELTGLELSYQQPFGDTGFGTLVNATLTDSQGTFDVQGEEVISSLSGQSDATYNIIAYYEKHGASVRLAFSHRDEYRNGFSSVPGSRTPFFVRDRDQLDISASYHISEDLTLSFDVLNVTGEDQRDRRDAGLVRQFIEQEPIYVFGLRYKL